MFLMCSVCAVLVQCLNKHCTTQKPDKHRAFSLVSAVCSVSPLRGYNEQALAYSTVQHAAIQAIALGVGTVGQGEES